MRKVLPRVAQDASIKRASYPDDYPTVERCIAFVDITSFTSFTDSQGNHAAASMVAEFRQIIRHTTGKHAVRVARWLGDGVMLVGLDAPSVVQTLQDVALQCYDRHIAVHCGVARGQIIIFDGDDYIGRTVNIAARLSHIAGTSEIYSYGLSEQEVPHDHSIEHCSGVEVRGIGTLNDLFCIKAV